MAEIAGIVVPELVFSVAPLFVKFVKKKMNERKKSLADIHEVLNNGLDELLALRSSKERQVLRCHEQKDPSELYENWKKRVSKIKRKVSSLNREYDKVKAKKEFWRNPQFWGNPQSQVEMKIKKALKDVIELLEGCPENVLVDKLPDPVKKEIAVPQISKYSTLDDAFKKILTQLQRKRVKCVALFGQIGVGKTTILQYLNNYDFNHNCDDMKFDMVIFIKVTVDVQTNPQREESHILQKIAERIMVGGNGDELVRNIKGVLEKKIYLLILDGVRHVDAFDEIWGKLDISRHKSRSKVVISTHYLRTSTSNYVGHKVNLGRLSRDDAWKMFRNIVGSKNLKDIDIPKAQLICRRLCFRLPHLIRAIAKSYKSDAPIDWDTNLDESVPWPEYGVDGLVELFSILKICYDRLRDRPREQNIFLYAALYPANKKIYTDYFVECCIAQGFLGDVRAATNYKKLHRQGVVTLRHLVNVAFLEGPKEEMIYVKMNDFYRQLALHISSIESRPKCKIYVDNEHHGEVFRSKSWKSATWVSMVESKRDSLPANQNFMSLETLLLGKSLVEIQKAHFCTMGNLLVLNLNGTIIRSLPFLTKLTSLKVFYLKGCSNLIIDSGDEIQKLTNLEVFDSRGTQVKFVPYLKNLRCLRISYSPSGNHHKISRLRNHHEISRFKNLQELTIEVEVQFRPQWNDVAPDIGKNAGLRKINFICDYV